tara:strand:- start:5793 stop:6881 length:1089 start_codon:yes stop_codon:yes gene_type:complete
MNKYICILILILIFLFFFNINYIEYYTDNLETTIKNKYNLYDFKVNNINNNLFNTPIKYNNKLNYYNLNTSKQYSIKYKNRNIWIDIPNKLNKDKYPFVLYIQPEGENGVQKNNKGESKFSSSDTNPLHKCLNYLITQGIAVISLEPDPEDMWYWMRDGINYDFKCINNSKNYQAGVGCFNSKKNKDIDYFNFAFDYIYNHNKLDYNNMFVIGYSAGSQMVSASIGEFPFLYTKLNRPYPKIKAAIMIAGGSQYCYTYYDISKLPDIFKPCYNKKLGCCPKDATEYNFMNGKLNYSQHPPTFLFQTNQDNNADKNASNYYFDACTKYNIPSAKIIAEGNWHGLVTSQEYLFNLIIQYYLSTK